MSHLRSLKMSYRPIKENREKRLVGSVVGLFISKSNVDKMNLDEGGVLGDKFYAKRRWLVLF